LRSTTVRFGAAANLEVMEGTGCNLNLLVEHTAPWPAFMVDIETEWEWASKRIVLSQTIPVIHSGRVQDLGRLIHFPCRGHYELIAVRLSSGFPLGLMRAHHVLLRPQIHTHVLPKAQSVQWPLPWDITDDPLGELTTRRVGQSFELGMMRPYQYGESVGRVSWHASARAGELVIQHFRQSGSVRLRVAIQVPRGPSLGDADGSGEQAIRLAVGVCNAAAENSAQLFLYLEDRAEPVRDLSAVLHALAEAEPSRGGFFPVIARIANEAASGEQVALVVSSTCPVSELLAAVGVLVNQGCRVVVCIALGRRSAPFELTQALASQKTLQQAGFATFMEAP